MKPGFLTSEFTFGVGVIVANLLIVSNVITTEQQQEVAKLIGDAIFAVVSLGAFVAYTLHRNELKKKQMELNRQG